MNRSIFLIILTAVVLMFSFSFMFSREVREQPILPVIHADGTKEFRLINAGSDRKSGTEDDQHWVLQMPAGIWATSLDEGRTKQQIKDNPDYPYNLNFDFIVQLPDFSPLRNPYERVRHDLLQVLVSANQVEFGDGAFNRFGVRPFSTRFELLTDFNCRKEIEIGPGVFALRQPTAIETQEMITRFKGKIPDDVSRRFIPPECSRTARIGRASREISIYSDTGKPIGFGYCLLQGSGATLHPEDNCRFLLWLPIEREISVRLSARFVPDLQDIYARTAALLEGATDYTKSANVVDWEAKSVRIHSTP